MTMLQFQSTQTTFLITVHVQFHSIQKPCDEEDKIWLIIPAVLNLQPDLVEVQVYYAET